MGLSEPLVLNLERDYWTEVFEPMLDGYWKGVTPNPDVACNREIKFGPPMMKLVEDLAGKEIDLNSAHGRPRWWIATGHYARTTKAEADGGEEVRLLRAPNAGGKDQTYFLSQVSPSALSRCFFPLGHFGLSKPEVKDLAKRLDIPGWREDEPNGPVKESMGLCFVEPKHLGRNAGFRRFLGEFLEAEKGPIKIDEFRGYYYADLAKKPKVPPPAWPRKGLEVGKHEGLWQATVGEKAHLELPQGNRAFQGRWYVSRKDRETGEMWVVRGQESAQLWARKVKVGGWRWAVDEEVRGKVLEGEVKVGGQFRHGMAEVGVKVRRWEEKGLVVEFEDPQKAVAEGQVLALWWGEMCLGSGVVEGVETVADDWDGEN